MMIPIAIPTVIVVLTGVAYWKSRPAPVMSAEHEKIYKAAINGSLKDPRKLRALSDAFAGEGFVSQAKLLRQRAALRELPDPIKRQRRQIFRNAMKSTNKAAVLHLAKAYEKQGCTTAALRLREYASGLTNPPHPSTSSARAAS